MNWQPTCELCWDRRPRSVPLENNMGSVHIDNCGKVLQAITVFDTILQQKWEDHDRITHYSGSDGKIVTKHFAFEWRDVPTVGFEESATISAKAWKALSGAPT